LDRGGLHFFVEVLFLGSILDFDGSMR
jgi:hypothetical protein